VKLLMAAASDWRTLIWLGIGVVSAAVLSNPFPAVIGLGLYLWFVQRLAHSPAFQSAASMTRTAERLAEHYRTLQKSVTEVSNLLSKVIPPGQGRSWFTRASDVVTATREIYHEWLAHPAEHAAQTPLVEEGLQMAGLYLRLLRSYHTLYANRKPQNLGEVQERLERNRRRADQTVDQAARHDLNQAIDMDERVLEQAAGQEAERERYQARLAAIESTMDLLRRQIFDPETTGEGERLHEMLLEAEAMEDAMSEVQQQTRIRAR